MFSFIFFILTNTLVSEESLRYTDVYKQGFDTSCGISVTSTLLNTYWNIPLTEEGMYQEMIINRMHDTDTNYIINFLTIGEFMREYQVQSRAYKMDWDTLVDTLSKGYAPIIIHYSQPRPHFTLLFHINTDFAYVADPARGFQLVHRSNFEDYYSGNAMLTASLSAQKNNELIQELTASETTRLDRLQDLSRMRGRR
jgi:predicted double-glycine peptidase